MDEGRITALKPFQTYLDRKGSVRKATEASGIPYTYVIGNCCAQYFLHVLFHPYDKQADTVIYGTGETKGILNLTIGHMVSFQMAKKWVSVDAGACRQ